MKVSNALTALFVVLPLFAEQALAAPKRDGLSERAIDMRQFSGRLSNFFGGNQRRAGGRNGGGRGQQAPANGKNGAAATTAKVASSAAAATATAPATANNAANGNKGGNNNDPQKSLTLLASQVQPNLANDGQDIPDAGQVPSLTSTNNFINYCATQNVPLTNGQQSRSGSCNPTPMGIILATDKCPSAKFAFPPNLATLKADTKFTIQMNIKNLVTGNFVNAQQNYYAAPAQKDSSGTLVGHSHVVIEKIDSFQSTKVTNPNIFAFFKGLNAAAVKGQLTADVTGGLPAGVYKMSSINSAANHQPALCSVAQHGSLDDSVYFEVTANGKPSAELSGLTGGATAAGGAAAGAGGKGAVAASSAAPAAATTAKGGKGAVVTTTPAAAATPATGKGGKGAANVAAPVTTTKAAAPVATTKAATQPVKQQGGFRGGRGGRNRNN